MQEGDIDLGVPRVGALHGVGQQHHAVVEVGAIDLELAGELGVVAFFPLNAAGHFGNRGTAVGADHVVQRLCACGHLGQLQHANAIAAEHLHVVHAQLGHLAQHGASLAVHTAVENGLGFFRLDRGEDGHEIGGLVVGELAGNDLHAQFFRVFLVHAGQALAVGGAVVNHGHIFQLEHMGRVVGQGGAQGVVVGNHAVGGVPAGLGQVGVGGGAGDHRNATVVKHLGGRNSHTRVHKGDGARHLVVAQLLRSSRALLGIGRIVFGHDLEFHLLACDFHALGVEVFNGHAHAVFIVLAKVGLGAGDRANVADFDDLLLCHGHRAHARHGSGNQQLVRHLHRGTPEKFKRGQTFTLCAAHVLDNGTNAMFLRVRAGCNTWCFPGSASAQKYVSPFERYCCAVFD